MLCAAAVVAYLGRSGLGVAEGKVSSELGLDEVRMGWAMSAFFWGYAVAQIPAGWIGQLIGPSTALAIYATVWAACCAAIGGSFNLTLLIATQFAFGVAQAGVFPCAAQAISVWVPNSWRGISTGLLGSSMSVGAAASSQLAGVVLEVCSWRLMFVLFAIPSVVWAIIFYWVFRDRPDDHPAVNDAELAVISDDNPKKPVDNERQTWDWLAYLASFDLWMVNGQQFFRAAGYVFYTTWFPKYLKEMHGVSTLQSGLLASLPLLAVVVGSTSGGFIVDAIWKRTQSARLSRQAVGVCAMLGCASCISLAYFVHGKYGAVAMIAAGSFCAAVAGPCAYTITIDKAGKAVAPVFGIMNMSGNIGAALCPTAVGYFVAEYGWSWLLLPFAGIYVVAAFCWLLLNPQGEFRSPKPKQAA